MADPSIRDLADKVDDLSRLVARQSGALAQLADARRRPGVDVALLVDLHALRGDALAAAGATRSGKERGTFEAIATGLERLLAGRGGVLVAPRAGHPFSAATMEAAEEVACEDAALDRTVAALLAPGLEAEGRTVRPARVAVHRYTTRPVAAQPPTTQPPTTQSPTTQSPTTEPQTTEPAPATGADAPERNGHARVNGTKTSKRATRTADPEPVRRSRPARRAQGPTAPQPEPARGEPEADEPTGDRTTPAEQASPKQPPAKRGARRQPARKP